MTGPLLTARELAGVLGVTPATVLRWTRQGDLPAIRLPSGQIRYRPGELDQWMRSRATPDRGVLTAVGGAARSGTLPSKTLTAVPDTED